MSTSNDATIANEPTDLDLFHNWLDSLQPDWKESFDLAPIGWPLELLSACTEQLSPHYCDRLEITHGSSYADAINELRQRYAHRHADDGGTLIGRETWWCDGMPVTPQMRQEILLRVASSFDEHGHIHREWQDSDDSSRFLRRGCVVVTEETPQHETLQDFFVELTGEVERHDGYLRSYSDDLHEWLRREYFPSQWSQDRDWFDTDYDGDWKAAARTFQWLEHLRCAAVMKWRKQQKVKAVQ